MWQVKCVKDSLKGVLPFQDRLRRGKDLLLGYRREPRKDTNTILDGLRLIRQLGNLQGKRVMEIGSGWQPMIPMLFSFAGATVLLTDKFSILRPATLRAALESIAENRDEIAQALGIEPSIIDHATRPCPDEEMPARLAELRLEYLAPCDCRNMALGPASLDVVFSRAVLEHIPPQVIQDIFIEAHRLLRPSGVMLNLVDHSDHWAHRDKSITDVNFLQYPDWLFALTCINPQNYQNRLRHSDYCDMLRKAGFTVQSEDRQVDPKSLAALSTMQLAPRFRGMDPEDLATTTSTIFATMGPSKS